ncbi:MAG: glycosyltransferase, partial [Akkermansia sp.]
SYLFSQSTIRFTDTFADTKKGLCYADYWRELCRTRIVLAPPGFRSAETVRHIEAARAGCVVISAPLPQHEFYRDCPFIICKDWRKILPLMMEVAEDEEELTRLGAATRKWYEEHFTPRAWAIRIAAHVRGLNSSGLTP